jgi:hypothetical protein
MQNKITANKKNILQQCVTTHPGKKVKLLNADGRESMSKYNKSESML